MQVLRGKTKFLLFFVILFFFTTFQTKKNTILPIFKIKNIVFLNPVNFEQNIQNNLIDNLINKNLFNIDYKKIDFILNKSNWIKSYKIKKKYPHEIYFELNEFKPIAIKKQDDGFFLINGNFITTNKNIKNKENLNLIQVIGEYETQNLKNIFTKIANFEFFKELNTIKFLKMNRIELILNNNTYIKLGNYNMRMQFKFIDKIIKTKKFSEYIDLRNEGSIIIK